MELAAQLDAAGTRSADAVARLWRAGELSAKKDGIGVYKVPLCLAVSGQHGLANNALDEIVASLQRSPGGLEGPSKTEIDAALKQWEAGRVALNSFYDAMNKATESKRLVLIPAEGKGYPRARLSQPSQTLNR